MPNHQPPPPRPTEPIRPSQGGTEPIPERVRQPIVVPRHEATIAGLPRPLVVAGIVALTVAVGAGFLLGRSFGDGSAAVPATEVTRRASCERALAAAMQVGELRERAFANRAQAVGAATLGDGGQVAELDEELEVLLAAIRDAEGEVQTLVERCRAGARKGGRGEQKDRSGRG